MGQRAQGAALAACRNSGREMICELISSHEGLGSWQRVVSPRCVVPYSRVMRRCAVMWWVAVASFCRRHWWSGHPGQVVRNPAEMTCANSTGQAYKLYETLLSCHAPTGQSGRARHVCMLACMDA
eukprot:366207-Chlamydomonas_euryale.AAC.3